MKTLIDLFDLILSETQMSEGKASKYVFDINTEYNWVSMRSTTEIIEENEDIAKSKREIFTNLPIETSEQIDRKSTRLNSSH